MASNSPRRKELLAGLDIPFDTVSYADTYAAVTIESASDTSAPADNNDEETIKRN